MAEEHKRMRQLTGTEAEWTARDPVLLHGETAYSSDVKKYKVGDGTSYWSSLEYWDEGDIPSAPEDGYNYGIKDGVWTPTVELNKTYTGDLNQIPDEHVSFTKLQLPLSNVWPDAKSGDYVLHMSAPNSTSAIQTGYHYSTEGSGQTAIYTRVRRGSGWTDWITNVAFSSAGYNGSTSALANSDQSYSIINYTGLDAVGGWEGMSPGDIIHTTNIDADSAQQIGYSTGTTASDTEIWLRRKEGGVWGQWNKQQVNAEDIEDLFDFVYSQSEVDQMVDAVDDKIDDHINDHDNPHQVTWEQLDDVPAEFPPADHTHVEDEITDLDKFDKLTADNHFLIKDGRKWVGGAQDDPEDDGSWETITYDTMENALLMEAGHPIVSLGVGGLEVHYGWGGNDPLNPYNRLSTKDGAGDASFYFGMKYDGAKYVTARDQNTGGSAFIAEYDSEAPSLNLILAMPAGSTTENAPPVPLGTELVNFETYRFSGNIDGDDDVLRLNDHKKYFIPITGTNAESGPVTNAIDMNFTDVTETTHATIFKFISEQGDDNDAVWMFRMMRGSSGGDLQLTNHGVQLYRFENNLTNSIAMKSSQAIATREGGDLRWARVDHDHVEADITDLDRVRWRSPYVNGTSYKKNDMVLDGDWTMIANKDTTDRAAPQDSGNPEYDLPAPIFTEETHLGVVQAGREWTTTEPITVIGYQVWVPTIAAGNSYRIKTYSYPTGFPDDIQVSEVSDPLLAEDTWSTIAVPEALINQGTTFGLFIRSIDTNADTIFTGSWVAGGDKVDPEDEPPANGWGRSKYDSINFDVVDLDSNNRADELMGMIAGSVILVSQDNNAGNSFTLEVLSDPVAYKSDGTVYGGTNYTANAAWVTVETEVIDDNGYPVEGQNTTCTFTTPIVEETTYVLEEDGNPDPDWGTSKGFLYFDGVEQTGVEGDAFGVRILVDTWDVSEDWDVVSIAGGTGGSGGSGGGSGVTSFIDLIDTPETYIANQGKIPVVNQTETGLDWWEPGAIESVPILTDSSVGDPASPPDKYEAADAINGTDYSTFEGNPPDLGWDQQNADTGMVRIDLDSSVVIAHRNVLFTYIGRRKVYLGATPAGGHTIPPEYADYETYDVQPVDLVAIATSDHSLLANLDRDDHPQYLNELRGNAKYLQLAGGTMLGNVIWNTDDHKVEIGTNGIGWSNTANEYGGEITASEGALKSTFEFIPNGDDGTGNHALKYWKRLYYDDATEQWGIRQGESDNDNAGDMSVDAILTRNNALGDFVAIDGSSTMTGPLNIDINGNNFINLYRDDGSPLFRIVYRHGETEGTTEVAGFFEFDVNNQVYDFYMNEADGGEGANIARIQMEYDEAPKAMSTLITRAMGDERYIRMGQASPHILIDDDMNLHPEFGFYAAEYDEGSAAPLLNLPQEWETEQVPVIVMSYDSDHSVQIIADVQTDELWFRTESDGTWNEWRQLFSYNPALFEGYVERAGDTMSGHLKMDTGARIGIGHTANPVSMIDIRADGTGASSGIQFKSFSDDTLRMFWDDGSAVGDPFVINYVGSSGYDFILDSSGDIYLAASGSGGSVKIGGAGGTSSPPDPLYALDVNGAARARYIVLEEQGGIDAEVIYGPETPFNSVEAVSTRYVNTTGDRSEWQHHAYTRPTPEDNLEFFGTIHEIEFDDTGPIDHRWYKGAGTLIAQMDYTGLNDLPSPETILTRERADANYIGIGARSPTNVQKIVQEWLTVTDGTDSIDIWGHYIQFPNIEGSELPAQQGALGFDESQGMQIYHSAATGEASGEGFYTILDGSNIQGADGITITNAEPGSTGSAPFIFGFDPGEAGWLDGRWLSLEGGSTVTLDEGETRFEKNTLWLENDGGELNSALRFISTVNGSLATMRIGNDGVLKMYVGEDYNDSKQSYQFPPIEFALQNDTDVATRQSGDARWLQPSTADIDYVRTGGDTMTGALQIEYGLPGMYLRNNSLASGLGEWRYRSNNEGSLRIDSVTDNITNGLALIFQQDEVGIPNKALLGSDITSKGLTDDGSIVTRITGDARWLALTGGRLSGTLTAVNTTSISDDALILENLSGDGTYASMRAATDGDLILYSGNLEGRKEVGRMDVDGLLNTGTALVTRDSGDARYLQAANYSPSSTGRVVRTGSIGLANSDTELAGINFICSGPLTAFFTGNFNLTAGGGNGITTYIQIVGSPNAWSPSYLFQMHSDGSQYGMTQTFTYLFNELVVGRAYYLKIMSRRTGEFGNTGVNSSQTVLHYRM